MVFFWILLACVLGPIVGCLVFVFLTNQPNILTAALGAIIGMLASLVGVLLFA